MAQHVNPLSPDDPGPVLPGAGYGILGRDQLHLTLGFLPLNRLNQVFWELWASERFESIQLGP